MMRLPAFLAILLAVFNSYLEAQIPEPFIQAERSKILAGVTSVPKTGAPGPVAIWGALAFPILSAPDKDGVESAVAAAAAYGKGRVILFGHNGYLDADVGGDHGRLMENCLRWVANKDKMRVSLKNVKTAAFYRDHGFPAEAISGPVDAKALKACDVLVLNMQTVTSQEEGVAIAEFIKNGGGLIAGMTGWAFNQTSGGKDLVLAHEVNRALLPVGVAITEMSGFNAVRGFESRKALPRGLNAGDAVSAIKQQTATGSAAVALGTAEMKQATQAIQLALAVQPPGRNQLQASVLAALGDVGGGGAIPTPQTPLTAEKDAAQRLRLGMETRVLRLASGEGLAAHPAHQAFPGKVPPAALRVNAEVQVNPSIPGWTSTGLYAAAGEPITVVLPNELAVKGGYAVRIGCHSDTLYHLDKWERAPEITRTTQLTAAETKTASAFGGLIYVEVPARAVADQKPFTVTIRGGVPAPLFVLGKDDDAKWNNELKNRPAPWAEFACDKVILSCPSEVARTISNPTQLMEFWTKVVEAQDDISNQAAERKRPERIVADVQISAGYMHSGYPIMVPTSTALEMVTFTRLKFPGWGFYHELGHNHQRDTFTYDGTVEVTNNVLGMYCYEAVLGKDWLIGHTEISEAARKDHLQKIQKASDKWALWKSSPFVALTTYIQLVQAFGWESWRAYLHSFTDTAMCGPVPKNDTECRDQFLIRYSKITKKNLGPFFDAWGIPVSSSAKDAVAGLDGWMPKGM